MHGRVSLHYIFNVTTILIAIRADTRCVSTNSGQMIRTFANITRRLKYQSAEQTLEFSVSNISVTIDTDITQSIKIARALARESCDMFAHYRHGTAGVCKTVALKCACQLKITTRITTSFLCVLPVRVSRERISNILLREQKLVICFCHFPYVNNART